MHCFNGIEKRGADAHLLPDRRHNNTIPFGAHDTLAMLLMIKGKQILLVAALTVFVLVAVFIPLLLLAFGPGAPGCYQNQLFMGGCFGVNKIRNLRVEPEIGCLKITTNNCNGGILEISNDCKEAVSIGDQILPPEKYYYSYWMKDENGNIVEGSDETGKYFYPLEDESIVVNGRAGDKEFTVSYTRTKALC